MSLTGEAVGHCGQGGQSMVGWVPSLGPCFIFGPYPIDEIALFRSHSWVAGGNVIPCQSVSVMPPQQLAELAMPEQQVAEPNLSGHRFRLVNSKLLRPSLPKNTKWRIRNAKLQHPMPRHFAALGRTNTWDLPPLGNKNYADNLVTDMWDVETHILSENGSAADSFEEWENVPTLVCTPRSEMPMNMSRPNKRTVDNWEDWGEEVPVLVKEPCNNVPVSMSRLNTRTVDNWEDKEEPVPALVKEPSNKVPVTTSRLNKRTVDNWEDWGEEVPVLVKEPCNKVP